MNTTLRDMEIYASKSISMQARQDPDAIGLSFGEPEFGPPPHALEEIVQNGLTLEAFLDSVKRYEDPRGSLELRRAISAWYARRYGLAIDPDTEVMVTHGGVEAITLAILCTSESGEAIAITDPSYMLYRRTILALGRRPASIRRTAGESEYEHLLSGDASRQPAELAAAKALIVNSPENPSGYMLADGEWRALQDYASRTGVWIIHDEVYDTMAFDRRHRPYIAYAGVSGRAIQINSCSKKFGMPGLRIGWMIASREVIDLASKVHDYLYLGVNIQYERIAGILLADARTDDWLSETAGEIHRRAVATVAALGDEQGFAWPRRPFGAMFAFPDVSGVATRLGLSSPRTPIGDAVAAYLMKHAKVAVVPGSVYGVEGDAHVRLVLCGSREKLNLALDRLRAVVRHGQSVQQGV